MIIAIALCVSTATNAQFSQKGDWVLGIVGDVGIGTNENLPLFGFGAKLQYNVSTPIRLEFAPMFAIETMEIYFVKTSVEVLEFNLNLHWLLPIGERINLYPLVGISPITAISDVSVFGTSVGGEATDWYLGINFGAGIDIRLDDDHFINVELKYNTQWEGLLLRLGVAKKLGNTSRHGNTRRW